MKILGIIPVRGGSKGVPKKNIRLLNGKPLIQYTSDVALSSNYLDQVIVSTEDDEIEKVARGLGLEVPFKRPNELATDESPTILTLIHALEYYKCKGIFYDAVCLLQVTNPFRTSEFIDKAIEKFRNVKSDSLLSVLKVPHEYNPHWIFEVKESGNLKISTGESEIISRRQELPTCYYRDGSIYITKTKVLLNQKSLYGKSISYIESDESRHVNIDTMKDWVRAEELAINLNK